MHILWICIWQGFISKINGERFIGAMASYRGLLGRRLPSFSNPLPTKASCSPRKPNQTCSKANCSWKKCSQACSKAICWQRKCNHSWTKANCSPKKYNHTQTKANCWQM